MGLEWDCRRETLTGLLIRSVRYGGGAEACLASRCLGLMSVTLGAGDDSERCRLLLIPCSRMWALC